MMCIIILGFFNHDFRSACSTHLGVSASYFKECVHYKFRNVSGMCGAAFFPAGRGKGKNPQGGAKVKIRGAGRGEKVRKLSNSQNFTKVRKRKI